LFVYNVVHEQTIVHWLDGTDVTRCPDCTKSFNITRRQHHCRLCGSIVCHECSCFLPLSKACWYFLKTDKLIILKQINLESMDPSN